MATDERDRLSAFALRVWGYKQGEVVSLMIHLGDRLGLYRAMTGRGAMTAARLATDTGLQERWLLEWLRGQAAAGLIGTDDGEWFELSAEAEAVLADSGQSLWFAAGAFAGGAAAPDVVERLAGAFRSGIGLSYNDLGPAAAEGVERMTEPWTRLALVPLVLPALDGVLDRLHAGALVVDVGCGSGVAVCVMAAAFRASRFEGVDPSDHAVSRARSKAAEAGLENVVFRTAGAEDLPDDNRYDFVTSLDCLHDMPRPAEGAAAIRRAIRPDGTWLIKDIRSSSAWQDNLRNPMLAMMYGLSVTSCMSSGLSEPGGAGLGTLGLHPELAESICREAGFSRFVQHDFEDPVNLYYEVRP
jgi:2-polyprenyl-3-methyl-5-hydroxy-6-metoxy-1,4-benzoquinol methylase